MATDTTVLKELAARYQLTGNDFFKSPQGFVIITRTGIEKIMHKDEISVEYDLIRAHPTEDSSQGDVIIKAKAYTKKPSENDGDMRTYFAESFGSANEHNCTVKTTRAGKKLPHYPVETAEKRAMARSVLKLTGFYKEGVFSEDESDDFKNQK